MLFFSKKNNKKPIPSVFCSIMLFFSKEKNKKLIPSIFCSIMLFFSKEKNKKTNTIHLRLNNVVLFKKRTTKKLIPSICGLIMSFFSKKNNKKLLHPFAAYVRLAHGILCFKIFGTGFFFPYRFDHNNIGN